MRQRDERNIIGCWQNLYLNKACIITATGPSLANAPLDAMKQAGVTLFGVNNSPAVIRPHLWCCGDSPDNFLASIWLDPNIIKFCPTDRIEKTLYDSMHQTPMKQTPTDCPNVYPITKSAALPDDDGSVFVTGNHIYWGYNNIHRCVLVMAIGLCYALGFVRVYLMGVDWNMRPDKQYAFDQTKDAKAQESNNGLYNASNHTLKIIRPVLESKGMHIYNATPDSKLTVFDAIDPNEAVNQCREINLMGIYPEHESTQGMYR